MDVKNKFDNTKEFNDLGHTPEDDFRIAYNNWRDEIKFFLKDNWFRFLNISKKKPLEDPGDVFKDYMFEEYGLGMDITEDESKENMPSIWCLPIALALTAAVYVITGMITGIWYWG